MAIMKGIKNTIKEAQKQQEEQAVVSRVQHMYRNAYDAKSSLHDKWKKSYEAYTGELFKRNVSTDRSNAVINHIFSTVETIKPIMLSNYPKPVVLPKREMFFEKAIMVQNVLEYEYRRTKMFEILNMALPQGLIYGNFILGVFWNGEASRGLGEIEPVLISPFNFFIDPMATSIDDAEYVMYATYKNYGEIAKSYPDKAEKIKNSVTGNIDENLSFGKGNTDNARNQVLYIEAYFRDYAYVTEVEDEIDNSGNPTGNKYEIKKMKYPNGRRVCLAGDVLLSDGENPYNDGKFPFVSWKCYPVANSFWALSDVEMLVSPQKHMIDLIDDVIENANLMGNPVWIMDKNSGVERNSLTNRKGLVVRKNPGSEVRRETPPSMPGYIQAMINELKQDIEIISGVFEATRGQRPASITSGVAITALQEQSQGRIKLKTQNLEFTLSDFFSMCLRRIQQFWVVPRTVRMFGTEYVPNSQKVEDGRYMRFESVSKDEIDGDFDIEILTGSTMPINRSARLEQLLRLSQTPAEDGMPMIDRRTVLEYTELDNVDEIIKRFEQQKEQQMQQAKQENMMQQQNVLEQQNNKAINEADNAMLQAQLQAENKAMPQEGLQANPNDVQSVPDDVTNNIQQLVDLMGEMSPQEIDELIAERPEIGQILQQIFEQP